MNNNNNSNSNNSNGDDNGTTGIMVQVDADTLGDLRTFPERVYDMVMSEDQNDHNLILWEIGEEGRSQFAMFRNHPRIPDILKQHIGKGDPSDFEMRLCKHGWEMVRSETHPGSNYAAYYHHMFRRGVDRSHLRDIKRVPKSERAVRRLPQTEQRHHRPQNPQDASFDGASTSGNVSDGDQVHTAESNRRNDNSNHSEQPSLSISNSNNNSSSSPSSNSTSNQRSDDSRANQNGGDTQHQMGQNDVIDLLCSSDDDGDDDGGDLVTESPVGSLAVNGQQQETMSSAVDGNNNERQDNNHTPRANNSHSEMPPAAHAAASEIPQPAPARSSDHNVIMEQARKRNVEGDDPSIIELSSDGDDEELDEDDDSFIEVVATVPGPSHMQRSPSSSPSKPATNTRQQATPDSSERATQASNSLSSAADGATDRSPAAAKRASNSPSSKANLQDMDVDSTSIPSSSGRGHLPCTPVRSNTTRLSATTTANCGEDSSNNQGKIGGTILGIKPNTTNLLQSTQASVSKKQAPIAARVANTGSTRERIANAENVYIGNEDVGEKTNASVQSLQDSMKVSRVSMELDAFFTKLKDGESTANATDAARHLGTNGSASSAAVVGDPSNNNFNSDHNTGSFSASAAQQPVLGPVVGLKQVEDNELAQLVKQSWKKAEQDCESRSEELLKKKLLEKRNKVVAVATNRKRSFHAKPRVFQDRLSCKSPSISLSQNQSQRNKWMTTSQNGSQTKLISVRLDGADPPQPRHNSPVSLSQLQFIEDQTELSHVPYFCDDEEKLEEILTNFYTTEERTKRLMRGASYEEENMNAVLDCFLQYVCGNLCLPDARGKLNDAAIDRVCLRITDLVLEEASVDEDWLKERSDLLKAGKQQEGSNEEQIEESICREDGEWKEYAKKVDTYRGMLCTRCFTYNCTFHGTGDEEKPCLALQYEKGVQRVEDRYWESVEFLPKLPTSRRLETTPSPPLVMQLSESQEALCQRMFAIFQGDIGKIAAAVRAPTGVVSDFIISKGLEVPSRSLIDKPKPTRRKYTSMGNYNQTWLDNINNTVDHPWCMPCSHTEPCSESTCSCVQNAFFCTKACGHAEYSPNFFRGCECKSNCQTASCACFAANRECDPDLCKTCGACCDPPNTYEKVNQRCHNDNMSMRRHRRLLIGKSTVAGWGLFTKDPLKKGDFIHEYVGELISHDESERRGHLYDLAKLSYLFDQCTEYAVDATLKGNKVRFGNHSDTPNVDTKKMFVNGNVRIGFFANQNIEAQSELFINYSGTFTDRGTFMKDMKAAPLEES